MTLTSHIFRCEVGIQEVPKDSALGRLRGSDNVVCIVHFHLPFCCFFGPSSSCSITLFSIGNFLLTAMEVQPYHTHRD